MRSLSCSYEYVGPLPDPDSAPTGLIVAYSRKGVHSGGRVVAWSDGSVGWVTEEQLHSTAGDPRGSLAHSYSLLLQRYANRLTKERKKELAEFYEVSQDMVEESAREAEEKRPSRSGHGPSVSTQTDPRSSAEKTKREDGANVEQQKVAEALHTAVHNELDLGAGVKMQLVPIRAGEFQMGLRAADPPVTASTLSSVPQHPVRITRPFYIGECEVTQEQYQAVMGSNPSRYQGGRRPVESVSWNDADEFCRKLSAKTGLDVRLPTEAEWEYACSAGSGGVFYFGDSSSRLGEYAWYVGNSGSTTQPVGQKKPNAWGLYDMHGNVWEWCRDWYARTLPGEARDDPVGPAQGDHRVARGAASPSSASEMRCAVRYYRRPTFTASYLGFRAVVSADR